MKTIDPAQFYELTLDYLYRRAATHTVKPIREGMAVEEIERIPRLTRDDVEKYFTPALKENIPGENGVHDIRCLFLRLCFHCQNGAFIRGVINYEKNYGIIRDFTFDFNPTKFLEAYPDSEKAKQKLTKLLVIKSGRTAKVGEYAERIHSFAKFVTQFDSYDDFVATVLPYGPFAPLFVSMNTKGMQVLAYDFLKELDPRFDLCKPDKHITEIVKALGLLDESSTSLMDLKVSLAIGDLAKRITDKTGKKTTAYKLDKMLWLICSETFYFHDAIPNSTDEKREAYLKYILPKLGIGRIK